ncbi:MAG: RNA polymerase sigma factor [Gemmata sp.]
MSDTTYDVKNLLGMVRRQEPGAIQALVARVHPRLTKLAAQIMRGSYPQLSGRREVDSVVSELYPKLAKALERVPLDAPADFFRFAAFKIRQVLLDMVAAVRPGGEGEGAAPRVLSGGGDESSGDLPAYDRPDSTMDIPRRVMWEEFHRQVDLLPDGLREVFIMHWCLDLTQAEIAEALGEHPKTVSRQWLAATIKLKPYLPQEES